MSFLDEGRLGGEDKQLWEALSKAWGLVDVGLLEMRDPPRVRAVVEFIPPLSDAFFYFSFLLYLNPQELCPFSCRNGVATYVHGHEKNRANTHADQARGSVVSGMQGRSHGTLDE